MATETRHAELVHLITRWSGKPKDETPICGSSENAFNGRTVYQENVTCQDCIDKASITAASSDAG